ncbi:MAG: hypothetical protein JXA89_22095 [Anaerolineae bacterium]|nr:hypothetical protein [Anaerolineae bacterium]
MFFIALKRLLNRPLLTLLSILGMTLSVGLIVSIPVFAKAVSFIILREELDAISSASGRPPFSMRIYVLPSGHYELSLETAGTWQDHITETILAEVGLPLVAHYRHLETTGLVMRTRYEKPDYGPPPQILIQDTKLVVLPGIESHMTVLDGVPMDGVPADGIPAIGIPTDQAPTIKRLDLLYVWVHQTTANKTGLHPGEIFEVYDSNRRVAIPVQVAGTWQATDPQDMFWFQNPDLTLQRMLLVRPDDYQAVVEPIFGQLGFASWYLILDDSQLAAENVRKHTEGLGTAFKIVTQYLPDPHLDSSPLPALEQSLKRESDLTVLMFAFSVPMMGFLLYFLSLLAAITIRWQQRETAVIISRGMYGHQLLLVSTIEAGILIGLGLSLGFFAGLKLAQAMGYTSSFMHFVRRSSLPVSATTVNVPMLAATLAAMFLARLVPVWRSLRTSIVAHEQRRSRPPQKPAWQRFYLDFLLLIPVIYAYRQLSKQGTLVPEAITGERATTIDPLLFLVPALFALTISLIFVRLFPLLMRIGDGLSALGRRATFYMAFRQLARQSSQYTNALLLVITSLSLGGFMASMAASLNDWLFDQVYYAVGSDVLLKQMIDPEYAEAGLIPPEGAWSLPIESYLDIPSVLDAARVGMYPATVHLNQLRGLKQTFIGVDRLDLPRLLFFRADFADQPLGGLMNQLASREDAVLLSERFMREANFQVGSKISIRISILDLILNQISLTSDFIVAGTYRYFPTVYEQEDASGDQQTAIIGNLDFLFEQIGGPELHHIWLKTAPDADKQQMIARVEEMGVFIKDWNEARDMIAEEQAKSERVGIFGTLTIGFLAATVLSGIGLLVYNYASLQERLFRFTILWAIGLSLLQVISQIAIEYMVLMVYSVLGGAAIGAWASGLFIPFFQAIDEGMLRPPSIIPVIAWQDIARISGVFTIVLVVAQLAVVVGVLRKGVFQALRLGDQE